MNLLAEPKLKICVVSISLAKGGAERSTAILCKMLQGEGFEVHLVLLNDAIDFEFHGQLLNLGLDKEYPNRPWKRFKRIQKLRHYLKTHNFHYIIDNRARSSASVELLYLNYVYQGFKFIYVVRSRHLDNYLTKHKWVAQLILKKVDKIVGVSKDISASINSEFKTKKTLTIYNAVENFNEQQSKKEVHEPYILFLGRLDDKVKNFGLLIEAYKLSKLSNHSVQLYIVGDGEDKEMIQQKINSFQLQSHVKLYSFTPHVYGLLKNALFLVLTSRHEGFPRVLIEALSVETPVISVNCKSGPSEIIDHEINGLLVENHNPKALAQAFDRFLLDIDIYNTCKSNSKQSVAHLNQSIIGKQWSKILTP
ncbi:glycosyltransferase [Gelidibacter sp.]|uniref:glycosyltransferase n=1 Tax=Gelidibacter sp. TaxID=2018083 RepID=UPI002C8CC68F|nr:glycosyltransferase [Gelidibacter sp.]HUH27402.1 glycosyltransferase [Gelidibacter sp.]